MFLPSLRVDQHLVAIRLCHHREGIVKPLKREAVRDDLLDIDESGLQRTLHQTDGLLHGLRCGTEAGIHAGPEEMGEPAVKLELLVRGDVEHVPARAD
jgi:hypothetical protein